MEHKIENGLIVFIVILASLIATFSSVKLSIFGITLVVGLLISFLIIYLTKRKPIIIAIILIFSTLLLPSIHIINTLPAIRPEFFIVIFAFISMLFSKRKLALYKNPLNKWFLIFGICILLSILYGAIRGYSIGVRDFYEIIKLVLYWMMYYVGLQVLRKSDDIEKIVKWSLVIFALTSLFGISQFFNIANMNSWLTPYYADIEKYGMIHESGQIVGTVGNPNDFGILLIFGALLALSVILMKCFHKKIAYMVLGMTSLGVLFTASRTALVGLLCGILLLMFYFYPRYNGFRRSTTRILVTVLVMLLLVSIGIIILAPDIFFVRSQQLLNISEDSSWIARLEMWQSAADLIRISPFLGYGPSKATLSGTVDNEWLLLLRYYGILGLSAFVCLFSKLYQVQSAIIKQLHNKVQKAYVIMLQTLLIVFAIVMIPAGVYHSMQLMPLYFLSAGIALSLTKYVERDLCI